MDLSFSLLLSLFTFIILLGANHASVESQIYWRTILPDTTMPSAIAELLKPMGANHASLESEIYWRTILPDTPMPSAIAKLIKPNPDGMSRAKIHNGKLSFPLVYYSFETQLQEQYDPALGLFFLRQDLRRGKNITVQLADNAAVTTATFIPRSAAESFPFSTAELPSILSRFGILPGSDEAAGVEKTLSYCERAPATGEKNWCATSLESMVDFAMGSLGTREVVPTGTEGDDAAVGEQVEYTIGTVRALAAAGKLMVACHPVEYAYAVFFCHATASYATASTEVYEVQLAAADGSKKAAKAVAVCHMDTSGWNPNFPAFRALKVKPGTLPVCHFLMRDHLVWTAKVLEKVYQ